MSARAALPVPARLRRYPLVAAGIVAVFLLTFLVVELAGVPLLTDPLPVLKGAGPATAAGTGIALLVADVVLPVPSSLVMIAHGALFGAAVGAVLSLVGSVGMGAAAFAIGRRGGGLIERAVPETERRRAHALLQRWGPFALVLSRPVPMLAETVAILAGASPLRWSRALGAVTLGALPPALVYALAGSVASTFASSSLVFVLVVAAAAALWLVAARQGR